MCVFWAAFRAHQKTSLSISKHRSSDFVTLASYRVVPKGGNRPVARRCLQNIVREIFAALARVLWYAKIGCSVNRTQPCEVASSCFCEEFCCHRFPPAEQKQVVEQSCALHFRFYAYVMLVPTKFNTHCLVGLGLACWPAEIMSDVFVYFL